MKEITSSNSQQSTTLEDAVGIGTDKENKEDTGMDRLEWDKMAERQRLKSKRVYF